MAKHNDIGKIGEELACIYLKKQGFIVIDRNYRRNNGEIDIIAKKGLKTHFIEVKSVSCERITGVSCENMSIPEENVTREKIRKLKNVISVYLAEGGVKEWSFGVCAVFIDLATKKSLIRFLEDELLPE